MITSRYALAIAVLGAASAVSPAAAQQVSQASASSVQTVSADPDAFSDTAVVPDTDLRGVTGREDTGAMIASATQRNTVAGNSVVGNSVTGDVRIDGNAFQNIQGLAVISANSGNNVAMNSAMNVTVNLAPR